ncbi:hypothetical protein [Hyperthermus butylicus]|nr:hypothetical protein [Hyperthermus butylicus]
MRCSPGSSQQPSGTRAVATIVGAAMLALALLALIAFYLYTLRQQTEITQIATEAAEAKLTAPLLASAIHGYYMYDSSGNLYIYIHSSAPRTVLATSLVILWNDTTTLLVDRNNESLSALGIVATVTHADGTKEQIDRFPIPLAPGDSFTLILIGRAANKKPSSIALSISASPIVAIIPIRPYTPVAGNITTAQPPQPAAKLYAELQRTAYSGTVTWSGTAYGTALANTIAQPQQVQLLQGYNLTPLDPALIQEHDNKTLIIEQYKPTLTIINITQETSNTIYFQDFDSCNVISTQTWAKIGGVWSDTRGLHGCGIGQSKPSTSGESFGGSGEYVAYPNLATGFLPRSGSYYIAAHVNLASSLNYHEIVLFDDPKSQSRLVAVGVYLSDTSGINNAFLVVDTWTPSTGWDNVNYSRFSITGNAWLTVLAFVNVSANLLMAYVYDEKGQTLYASVPANLSAGNPQFDLSALSYAGVGTYDAKAVFDDFIVSRANPLQINLRVVDLNGVPLSGVNVTIFDSSGVKVASGVTGDDGFVQPPLNIGWKPILRNAVVAVYYDGVSANISVPLLLGGENYTLYISRVYTIRVNVSTIVNTSLDLGPIRIEYAFSATAPGNYTIFANWNGSWVLVASGIYTGPALVVNSTPWYTYSGQIANKTNGTVLIGLVFTSSSPVNVSVDELNARYQFWNYSSFSAFIVGVGGSSIIDVYDVASGVLQYRYNMSAGSIFNGSTVIAYDPATRRLLLFNSSGLYSSLLSPPGNFILVNNTCRAQINAAMAVVNTSSASYAVLLVGGGGDAYCVVDLSTGNVIDSGNLSRNIGFTVSTDPTLVYTASAVSSDGSTAYFLVYDTSDGVPVIIEYNASTGDWNVTGVAPASRAVGMAYGNGYLWVLYERGSLYKIDPTTGRSEYVDIYLPFYPWGPGDRLEYIDSGRLLLFVRADGTREVWSIPTG